MKELKKDLQAVSKALKQVTRMTEQMVKRLDKLEKAQAPKKPRAKAVKKAVPKKGPRISATETVLAIIKRSRKGLDTATLRKRTGLKDNNIRAILSRLKKQGKIRSEGRGIYLKA